MISSVSPHAVTALVQRRGGLHFQGPVQGSVGEHGVADTYAVKERKQGSERRCELLLVTEESFVLCETFITSLCFSEQRKKNQLLLLVQPLN